MSEQNSPTNNGLNATSGSMPAAQPMAQANPQAVPQVNVQATQAIPQAQAPVQVTQQQTQPVQQVQPQVQAQPQVQPQVQVQQQTQAQPQAQVQTQTPVVTTIPATTVPAQPFVQYQNGQPVLQRRKSNTSTALIVGVVLCVIVAILVVGLVLIMYFRPDFFFGASNYEKPTTSVIKEAFEDADIPEPDLSDYMYIGSEDLGKPELSDFEAGDVTISSNMPTCIVSAKAEYENTSVKVEETLNIKMEHPRDADGWSVAGKPTSASLRVTPLGPADFKQIKDNFANILREYDSEIAAQFVNAEIQVEANLNVNGGTAVFVLKKPVEGSDEVKECTVNTDVSWSDSYGWEVKITSIAGLEEPEAEGEGNTEQSQESTDLQNGETQGEGDSGSSGNPVMELVAWSGDLVQVPGTVRLSNGHVLLQADYLIRVVFDGRTYITSYFELGVGASSVTSLTNGTHIMATGELSATGTLAQAPLVINLEYE